MARERARDGPELGDDLREWWHPGLAHVLGWQPWLMNKLKPEEYEMGLALYAEFTKQS